MKKLCLALLACCLLFVSCATVVENDDAFYLGVGMFPAKDLSINHSSDLESDLYEVLGPVAGSAKINVQNEDEFKEHLYGSLVENEILSLSNNIRLVADNPFAIALSSALNDMNKNAVELGASFVVFPNYFVEFNDGVLTVTTNATAVKVTTGTHAKNK